MHSRAKGKRDPVRCFPLLGLGPPWNLSLPRDDSPTAAVDLPCLCQRVEGKQVEDALLFAREALKGLGEVGDG